MPRRIPSPKREEPDEALVGTTGLFVSLAGRKDGGTSLLAGLDVEFLSCGQSRERQTSREFGHMVTI